MDFMFIKKFSSTWNKDSLIEAINTKRNSQIEYDWIIDWQKRKLSITIIYENRKYTCEFFTVTTKKEAYEKLQKILIWHKFKNNDGNNNEVIDLSSDNLEIWLAFDNNEQNLYHKFFKNYELDVIKKIDSNSNYLNTFDFEGYDDELKEENFKFEIELKDKLFLAKNWFEFEVDTFLNSSSSSTITKYPFWYLIWSQWQVSLLDFSWKTIFNNYDYFEYDEEEKEFSLYLNDLKFLISKNGQKLFNWISIEDYNVTDYWYLVSTYSEEDWETIEYCWFLKDKITFYKKWYFSDKDLKQEIDFDD